MARSAIAGVLTSCLAAAAPAAGCSVELGAVPDMPTYQADVRPILMSHCVRCHGDPLLGDETSAPLPPTNEFYALDPLILQKPPLVAARFDRYEDTSCEKVDGGNNPACFLGAKTFAPFISQYLADDSPIPMPPAPVAPLARPQIDVITRWAAETPVPLER